MQLRDIQLLPADAGREQIDAILTASPDWTLTSQRPAVLIFRHDAEDGAHRVFIPRDDNPANAEEHHTMCTMAVRSINAVALGLSPADTRTATNRLIEIINLVRASDTSRAFPTFTDIYAVATGQADTR
jgi:hypothetical protein